MNVINLQKPYVRERRSLSRQKRTTTKKTNPLVNLIFVELLIKNITRKTTSMKIKKNKGQIWVETVIYTLIGLAIITIILVTVIPRIERIKDKVIIEQTISAMNELDDKISEIETVGEVRIADFRVAKGKIEIDSANDSIIYVLEDTKLEMSEPGAEIEQGSVILKTEKMGSKFKVSLTMKYDNIDITYENKQELKALHAGATPYKIVIENIGIIGDKININLGVI